MTGSAKGRAKKTVEWQPAEDETQVPQQEDSPPAYHTMYPETPRPTKETTINTDHQQEKWEDKGTTSKDKQTPDGGKKGEQKTLVKISKETKEKLLEKAHGARATLR